MAPCSLRHSFELLRAHPHFPLAEALKNSPNLSAWAPGFRERHKVRRERALLALESERLFSFLRPPG